MYTTGQVIAMTGVQRTRLHDWLARGYVKASLPGGGKGFRNRFSQGDLHRIAAMDCLTMAGLSRDKAAAFVNARDWWPGKPYVIECPDA